MYLIILIVFLEKLVSATRGDKSNLFILRTK